MKLEFTVKKKGESIKKVFSGLQDIMTDDEYYLFTFDGSLRTCLKILWHLQFPSRKPIFIWEKEGI